MITERDISKVHAYGRDIAAQVPASWDGVRNWLLRATYNTLPNGATLATRRDLDAFTSDYPEFEPVIRVLFRARFLVGLSADWYDPDTEGLERAFNIILNYVERER